MADSRTTDAATARQTRDEELRARRTQRDPGTLDRTTRLKLAVPEHIRVENADQHLHWMNDEGNRLHDMTTQDYYTKVDGVEPVPVGTGADGKPIMAHLMRKPLEYWQEDQKAKTAQVNAKEADILQKAEPGSQIGANKSPPRGQR